MEQTCASCGGHVRFQQRASWAVGCAACAALILRDGFPTGYKHMALVNDLSPFKVGMVGAYKGKEFTVMGRTRAVTHDGYRNFWSLKGDIEYPWLVHAYGQYVLLKPYPGVVSKRELRNAKPGTSNRIDPGATYQVEYADKDPVFATEGELMAPLPVPYAFEIEMGRDPLDKVLVLIKPDGEPVCFHGVMVEYAELNFKEPLQLAQWT